MLEGGQYNKVQVVPYAHYEQYQKQLDEAKNQPSKGFQLDISEFPVLVKPPRRLAAVPLQAPKPEMSKAELPCASELFLDSGAYGDFDDLFASLGSQQETDLSSSSDSLRDSIDSVESQGADDNFEIEVITNEELRAQAKEECEKADHQAGIGYDGFNMDGIAPFEIVIETNEELELQAKAAVDAEQKATAVKAEARAARRESMKSAVGTMASHLAPLGAVVGVFAGIFQRVMDEIPPDFADKALCRASSAGILGAINDVMQVMIKGGTKYIPPLLPLAAICTTVLYRTGKGTDSWSINAVWESFKAEVQKAPVREMAMAASLVALAVISAVTEGSWAGTIPYIFDSSAPSGHVMMQIVLGLALVQSARAANLYGHKSISALTYAYGGVISVANAIFLSRTAYACHTVQEIQEGFKWAVAVFMGSRFAVGLGNAAINTGLAVKQLKADVVEIFARG